MKQLTYFFKALFFISEAFHLRNGSFIGVFREVFQLSGSIFRKFNFFQHKHNVLYGKILEEYNGKD